MLSSGVCESDPAAKTPLSVPGDRLIRSMSACAALAMATFIAAAGFALIALPSGLLGCV
jgi:hypothetical protein